MRFILILAIALFLCPALAYADLSQNAETNYSKAETVATVLKTLNKVYSLSWRHETMVEDKRFDRRFIPYLRTIRNPYALEAIAVTCFDLAFPGKAGDDQFDGYFERCFTEALFRLAEIKGKEAQDALRQVKVRVPLDGGGAEDYDDAVRRQNKLNSVAIPLSRPASILRMPSSK